MHRTAELAGLMVRSLALATVNVPVRQTMQRIAGASERRCRYGPPAKRPSYTVD